MWKKMEAKRRPRFRVAKVKFSVGQHVRICKEKMKFAKGGEQNFSTEIFTITKVTDRCQRPVHELEDSNKTTKEGQIYGEELTPVRIKKTDR